MVRAVRCGVGSPWSSPVLLALLPFPRPRAPASPGLLTPWGPCRQQAREIGSQG